MLGASDSRPGAPPRLERPAPATTQANLVAQTVAHLTLHGNAYIGKFRDETGQLEQLALLHPDRVQVELVVRLFSSP